MVRLRCKQSLLLVGLDAFLMALPVLDLIPLLLAFCLRSSLACSLGSLGVRTAVCQHSCTDRLARLLGDCSWRASRAAHCFCSVLSCDGWGHSLLDSNSNCSICRSVRNFRCCPSSKLGRICSSGGSHGRRAASLFLNIGGSPARHFNDVARQPASLLH